MLLIHIVKLAYSWCAVGAEVVGPGREFLSVNFSPEGAIFRDVNKATGSKAKAPSLKAC